MRVAVVTTSYPSSEDDPSGHFVRAEVRALERDGHEVLVVAPGAERRAFGWPGATERLKRNPLLALDAAGWIFHARRELLRARPLGRVVAHWTVPSVFPVAMGMDCDVEGVSHGGDVRALVAMPGPLRGWMTRAIARRVVAWRFVSRSLLDDLLGRVRPHDAELVLRVAQVLPSPIEIPDVAVDIERRRRDAGPFAVTVARLVEGKEVHRVIEHAALRNERLVVVGDGPEREQLESLAVALGVDARFVGKVPRRDALVWIGAADVVYHASRAEGLSTVAREAAALGTRFERL